MNEFDQEIISKYNEGYSIARIAIITGLSPTYITGALKEAGVFSPGKNIELRPKNSTLSKIESELKEIYQRYREGERLIDIAADYGVSRSTIYKALQNKGYEIRQDTGKRRAGTVRVSPTEFVEIWQSAKSIGDVIDATGMTPASAYSRASLYRKRGVPLKQFRKGGAKRANWDELSSFAMGLEEED